ncbi:3'-5' exonuclease [Bacillus phage vB_BceM-HSE3]|nr:3'-5' exonuclease [Bacillus phage vB_BceM-HSE3]
MTIYAIIDFETTGLDAENNQIIEMACIKTDLKRTLGVYHTYVKLGDKFDEVPEFIVGLTGVTTELTTTGLTEEEALSGLNNFIYSEGRFDNVVVVAQHVPFDFSYMDKFTYQPVRFLCTRTLSKLIEPEFSSSLKDVHLRLFGRPVPNHHSALADVEATYQVLVAQLDRAKEKGLTDIENVVANTAERPLKFIPAYGRVIEM